VFQEDDERFFVSVELTRSKCFVVITTASKMSSEVHYLKADRDRGHPSMVIPRREGVEYDVEHSRHPDHGGDVWLVRTNQGPDGDRLDNFALFELPVGQSDPRSMVALLPYRPAVKVESVSAFARHAVVLERADGLERLRVVRLSDGADGLVPQPEPAYTLSAEHTPEWDTDVIRFGYSSLVNPSSSVDYDMEQQHRTVVKRATVGGRFDPSDYRSERIWARAADGTRVPISLVCRSDQELDGSAPCLLYGYGSYEIPIDPAFSQTRLNLLERGFVFAIAHVRGGGEMGRPWYEDGRLQNKRNTFSDFIACAEQLVSDGWTSPDRIVIRGGSAGGLLMGAVANMRPDLWRAVVAEVPFVDVVTTMSDESLPLTVTEWEEWGNPRDDPEAYSYMKSYSPYDNVRPVEYPSVYVTAGLNDPRVGFWEPAKWVAKLRANKTDGNPLLLRTEMGAGHQGPSGRYDAWRDEARVQAFILSCVPGQPPEV
jgi:oligopeptidase B